MSERLQVHYRFRARRADAPARALAIALEQSTELPAGAEPASVHGRGLPGRVESLEAVESEESAGAGESTSAGEPVGRLWEARIALPVELVGEGSGALLNVLFGNSSMQADVALADAELPPSLVARFPGPAVGLAGIRQLLGGAAGPLTCTALKPVGLPVQELAQLAGRFARAGIQLIKDDHGIGDQPWAPFRDRVAACARAVADANASASAGTVGQSLYIPHLMGTLDALRMQLALSRDAGVRCVMVAPMVVGLPSFEAITLEAGAMGIAVVAHPALSGAVRMAPAFLLGRIYRLLGADAVIFVNHGGRFGTPPEQCRALADGLRRPWQTVRPALPLPAGGMTIDRVAEMVDFYGDDVALLISGALYPADAALDRRARAFVEATAQAAADRPAAATRHAPASPAPSTGSRL